MGVMHNTDIAVIAVSFPHVGGTNTSVAAGGFQIQTGDITAGIENKSKSRMQFLNGSVVE